MLLYCLIDISRIIHMDSFKLDMISLNLKWVIKLIVAVPICSLCLTILEYPWQYGRYNTSYVNCTAVLWTAYIAPPIITKGICTFFSPEKEEEKKLHFPKPILWSKRFLWINWVACMDKIKIFKYVLILKIIMCIITINLSWSKCLDIFFIE